jgi:hypothetical protein
MTDGQAALADGFAVTLSVHGQTWTRTSDAASVVGVATKLKPNDPKLAGTNDQNVFILVADQLLSPNVPAAKCMPTTRLRNGDELTKGAKSYRVDRVDFDESSSLWLAILSPFFS